MKSKVDQLDVDKLVPFPVDLSKLSDVVKNDAVKKVVYNTKVKGIEHKISWAQLYVILQTLYYTLKRLGNTEKILSWKSKGLSAEKRTTPTTTDNSLSSSIKWYTNSNFYLVFKRSSLKQKTQLILLLINFCIFYMN